MNRTGLIVALSLAAVVGLAFGFYPELDLLVSRYFYGFVDANNNAFAWRLYPPLMLARDSGLWVGTVLVAPAVVALLIKLILPRRKLLLSGRAILFLIVTLALGPGALVNGVLKEHWGRSRPIDVTQFGGPEHFVACSAGPSISSPGGRAFRVGRVLRRRVHVSHHLDRARPDLPLAAHAAQRRWRRKRIRAHRHAGL